MPVSSSRSIHGVCKQQSLIRLLRCAGCHIHLPVAACVFTLLHSERPKLRPKLYGVLAVLSAKGLMELHFEIT